MRRSLPCCSCYPLMPPVAHPREEEPDRTVEAPPLEYVSETFYTSGEKPFYQNICSRMRDAWLVLIGEADIDRNND